MSDFSSVFTFDSEASVSYRVEEDDGYASRASFNSPTKADDDDSSDYVNLFGKFKMDAEFCDPNFCDLPFQSMGPENQCFNTGINTKDENDCFDEQFDFLNDPSDITEKMEPWHSVECLSPEESLPAFSLFANEFLELGDSGISESVKIDDPVVPVFVCQSVVPESRPSGMGIRTFQDCMKQSSVSPISVYKDHHVRSVGSCRVRPNVSLRISGGTLSDTADAGDNFPSFVMVTDIGYVGALSCPVRNSRSMTPPLPPSNNDDVSKSTSIDQNRLSKRTYDRKRRYSAILDHDYLELDVYPKRIQDSLTKSRGCDAKESKTSDRDVGSVGLRSKMSRNYKKSKISHNVTTSMNESSCDESNNCRYVTLPGRHQSDFVYFAEKKPRTSKRRNSRTFSH